jgi:hypothetical protein
VALAGGLVTLFVRQHERASEGLRHDDQIRLPA